MSFEDLASGFGARSELVAGTVAAGACLPTVTELERALTGAFDTFVRPSRNSRFLRRAAVDNSVLIR